MLGYCLQGFFPIASIELLLASLPALLSPHGTCCIVLHQGVGYEVQLAQQFCSCRERLSPTVKMSVLPSLMLQG